MSLGRQHPFGNTTRCIRVDGKLGPSALAQAALALTEAGSILANRETEGSEEAMQDGAKLFILFICVICWLLFGDTKKICYLK